MRWLRVACESLAHWMFTASERMDHPHAAETSSVCGFSTIISECGWLRYVWWGNMDRWKEEGGKEGGVLNVCGSTGIVRCPMVARG